MNSTRFLKNFCALGLSVFSAVFALSYAFNADSNNQLDASNEAEVTSTGSAYGSSITAPFVLEHTKVAYIDENTSYLMYTGDNYQYEAGTGSSGIQSTFIPLYKNGKTVVSADGTPKADETGYFTDVLDYTMGVYHTTIIDEDGAVWSAGYNGYGQLGRGDTTNKNTFGVSNITEGAIKVSAGHQALVQMKDGSILGAGRADLIGIDNGTSNTTIFTETIDRFTVDSKRGIVDFACGQFSSYILFGDGDLWYSSEITTGTADIGTWDLMASNIKMFDIDTDGGYIYAVTTTNVILYQYQTDTKFSQMPTQPNEDDGVQEEVMQIRGASYNTNYTWGYLTTKGKLYLSANAPTPGNTHNGVASLVTSDVSYFDIGCDASGITYGYLTNSGDLNLWGYNAYGSLGTNGTGNLAYSARKVISGFLDSDDVPNINAGIFNTPPDCGGTVKSLLFL